MRWSHDPGTMFIGTAPNGSLGARIFRVNIETGHWRELSPSDPAGIKFIQPTAISEDGKTIIFMYNRTLAELFVADGIR